MALVCFDTNFVIWGIKQQATQGQEYCIERAHYIIEECQNQGDKIMIPSIVLGELLCKIPDNEQHDFIRSIENDLYIMPYDLRAATRFSRMWKNRLRDSKFTRAESKADYMIVATAIANSCKCIYSNDPGLKRFAESSIPVITIDEIIVPAEQLNLYEDD